MQLDEDTQSWLTHRNMSWSIRITLQAFCRTDWLTFFLKIWFQEHTHTHTQPNRYAISRNDATTGRSISTYTRQACLPCISMFFLYIFNNYFNKYFRFHKDTNAVVQMLQAFQVSELQYPAYTSDYKHGCHGSPKRSIRDRFLNRQTYGYTYVRIPYIERLVLSTLFYKVYASFALRCYKPHFCILCAHNPTKDWL